MGRKFRCGVAEMQVDRHCNKVRNGRRAMPTKYLVTSLIAKVGFGVPALMPMWGNQIYAQGSDPNAAPNPSN
jgi:hypothetical protein